MSTNAIIGWEAPNVPQSAFTFQKSIVDQTKALEAATSEVGRALTPNEEHIVRLEGFNPGVYYDDRDSGPVLTHGVGQTGDNIDLSFPESLAKHEKRVSNVIPSYSELPQSIQKHLLDTEYRGDTKSKTGGDLKWTKLFNDGKYEESATELLVHDGYMKRLADDPNDGVVKRLEATADAIRQYGKSLVPVVEQVPAAQYTVKSGDNLTRIAAANGMTVDQLAGMNSIQDPNSIQVGQQLQLQTQGIPQATQEAPPKEDAGFLSPVDDFINSLFGGDKSGKPKKEITDMIPPKHKETFKSFWDELIGD
jgi:LysM repeat protein